MDITNRSCSGTLLMGALQRWLRPAADMKKDKNCVLIHRWLMISRMAWASRAPWYSLKSAIAPEK